MLFIYLFIYSCVQTDKGLFGLKHVAENTINCCVLTGFIIILKPSSANLENCTTHHKKY